MFYSVLILQIHSACLELLRAWTIFISFIVWGIVVVSMLLTVFVHPLTLAWALVFYAILTRLVVGYLRVSWIIYILVLIFLGGVIVLVVYITTLAANEKFIITVNYSRVMLIVGVGLRSILFLIKPIEISVTISPVISMVAVLFDCSNMTIYVFRILYLLVALVCVIKIIKLEKGPLVVRR